MQGETQEALRLQTAAPAREVQQPGADWDAKKLSRDEASAKRDEIFRVYLAKCDCTLGPTRPRWGMEGHPGALGFGMISKLVQAPQNGGAQLTHVLHSHPYLCLPQLPNSGGNLWDGSHPARFGP